MKKLNYSKLYAFALTFWFTISGVQAAHAAINRTVAFGISERLRPDNSFYYTLGVGDSPFPPIVLDDRVEQFVLPGGQILDRIDQEIDIFESLEFDSFAALAQAVFGQWQFKTADTSDPLNFETYLFTVQSFELSDITVLRPQIFQPANGSVVDFPIQVRWDPSFRSYQFKGFGLQGNVTSIARGVLDVDLEVFPGSVNPYFTFEIISGSQLLSQYVLPVTAPIDPEFNLTIRSGFSRVANITIYPRLVPEPHSLTLLTMCMISLLALLRDPRVSA